MNRLLILLGLLLPPMAFGACLSGSIETYVLSTNVTDSCVGDTLTASGVSQGQTGYCTASESYFAGASGYLNSASTTYLASQMAGLTTWRVETDVSFVSIASGPIFIDTTGTSGSDEVTLRVLSNGNIRILWNGGATYGDSTGGHITTGTCYHMGFDYSSATGNMIGYCLTGPGTGGTYVDSVTITAAASWPTAPSVLLGNYSGSLSFAPLDGYMSNVAFYSALTNPTPTWTPTVTPTTTPTPTNSPTLTNSPTPNWTATPTATPTATGGGLYNWLLRRRRG